MVVGESDVPEHDVLQLAVGQAREDPAVAYPRASHVFDQDVTRMSVT